MSLTPNRLIVIGFIAGQQGDCRLLPWLQLKPHVKDVLGQSRLDRMNVLTETSSNGQSSRSRWGSLWI